MIPVDGCIEHIENLLTEIQNGIYRRAFDFRKENTRTADSWDAFRDLIQNKGGFVSAHWDGTTETENKIKEETKATIRCIPLDNIQEPGKCIYTGNPSSQRVLFAVAY